MSLELGAQRFGVFQSPMQGGDFFTGAGDFVLEYAEALGLGGFTGGSLGDPDAGLIGFGARLVERSAELLEPALQQQGPIRPGTGRAWTRRYAFSQGNRTMRHYSEKRQFAKPLGRAKLAGGGGRHTLRPLVVVMAGADEFDPYKD